MSRAYKPEYARHVEAFETWARAQEFYALFDECLIGWAGAATHYEPRIAELERENADILRDSTRIDWLAKNPLEALEIFGNCGPSETRFIRAAIDAAIAIKKESGNA